MTINKEIFGSIDGQDIFRVTLSNTRISAAITNYGASLLCLSTKDRFDRSVIIIAGLARLEQYQTDKYYLGATVGRYANRIGNGAFMLKGIHYKLSKNDGLNHLHGGVHGFNRKVWKIESMTATNQSAEILLSCISKAGEEGYPGTVHVQAKFTMTMDESMILEYYASTDEPTPFSITSHPYFNLSGFTSPTIHDHELRIFSNQHLEVDNRCIPTGKIKPNKGSPFDFSKQTNIGDQVLIPDSRGLNHTFVLQQNTREFKRAAILYESNTGRTLTISTDLPGLQVYTSNEWDGSVVGVQSKAYMMHGAIALETQHFPDAPNHAHFPDATLTPGKPFYSKTVYDFGVK